MVTHLNTVVFSYRHPEDGRIIGQNTVNVLYVKIHLKIKVHLFVVYKFYKFHYTLLPKLNTALTGRI